MHHDKELKRKLYVFLFFFKGALSGLRQFLAAENPLIMMKNAFYFTLEALFFFKVFKNLSWLFDHVTKRLDKKDNVTWETFFLENHTQNMV